MSGVSELHIVEGGDHSLLVTKRRLKDASETQADVDRRILQRIHGFVTEHAAAAA
jgi:hypothetical protein